MNGENSAIYPTLGQGSEPEPQGDDGAESAPKRAAHQCRFCPEVATRSSRGQSVDPAKAPTDLSPEELTQLRTKTVVEAMSSLRTAARPVKGNSGECVRP